MKKIVLSLLLLMGITMMQAQSSLSVPHFFSEGMVLQRGVKVPVWGKSEPGYKVTVTVQGKKASTTVAADGTWKVYLPKLKEGGPYNLYIQSRSVKKDRVIGKLIENVLVGDVFLCSGQSNMELPIRRCMDAVGDRVKDYSNDEIRYLKFPHQFNFVSPNDDVNILPWQNITPQNCAEVSGICYFMARELYAKYHVPIGIINSAVGGTQVQAWMPHKTLAAMSDHDAQELQKAKYHQVNWVDSVQRAEFQAGNAWEEKLTATDVVVREWRKPGYDFSAWKTVDMFSNWSNSQNGSYWFRTTVNLPKDLAGQKALLRFGAMKDADTIYVNGQYVGNTTYEYPPRVYTVKEGILREGENDIVVHLMSQSGMGNFTKGKLYQLEVGDKVFPLSSQLQMAVGCVMPRKPASTYFVDTPTGLYNAMIAPLQDFPFRGMLWYQGESNLGNADSYAEYLGAMVTSWRQQFKNQFPVVIMQLPGYMSSHQQPVETSWTKIRQQQYLAAQQIKKASLAPTFDTGEFNDIHPQDKYTAGRRAAQQMSRLVYGDKSASTDVPKPVKAKYVQLVNGGKVEIIFSETGAGGLKVVDAEGKTVHGSPIRNIAILVDGKYQWANARQLRGDAIEVDLPEGVKSTIVRYGWDDYPTPSLYNTEGVPVPQFEITFKRLDIKKFVFNLNIID